MQRSQLAVKFALPFAANASAGDNAYPVSVTSLSGGRASLNDGFPPITFVPIASGGIPPWGEDMNGILYQSTAWLQALQADAAIPYDSAFQTVIGGYPQGAIVESAVYTGLKWISTVDNNPTNPDTGGANWLPWPFVFYAAGGGTVNALTATFPLPLAAIPIGSIIWVNPAGTSTSTTPTLAINAGAAVVITNPLGAPLASAAIVTGIPAQIMVGTAHALWLLNSQAGGGAAPSSGSQYFGTPSTSPFSIPSPILTIKGWGAGGGGGGFYGGEFNGGGGGSGGFGEVVLTGLTVGAVLSVIIGAGGGGGSGGNGAAGGLTQVTLAGSPLLYLTGGGGGGNSGGDASGNFGGTPGTSLYGTINITGQYGSPFYLTGGSSPGGGVGGVGTAGNPGLTSPYPASSPGGGGGGGNPGGSGMPGGILFTWGT